MGADRFIGRVVGPYRVTQRLRETAGVTICIGEHLHLDRRVLLKWFQPATAAALVRAKEQVRALSRLKHRNVLPVIDFGEGGDVTYLALELGDGVPLRAVLSNRKVLPWREARRLGRQVTSALRAAVDASLAEAELSPPEVFLFEGEAGVGVRVDLATPEMLGLCDPSLVADHVHAVGRMLYLMVTGNDAASGPHEAPADPVLSWPELEIPPEADALIMRALDPEVAKRWSSLTILERELGGPQGTPLGTPSYGPVPAPPRGDFPADAFSDDEWEEGADGDEGADRSFGRSVFVRPSRRAVISGAVALGVAAVLLVLVVTSQSPRPTPDPAPGEKTLAIAPVPGAVPSPPVAPPQVAVPMGDAATPPEAGAPAPAPVTVEAARDGTTTGSPATTVGARALPAGQGRPTGTGGVGPRAEPPTPPEARLTVGGAPPATDVLAGLPAAAAGACAVSLGSRPWADVWLDGRRVGFTPLTDLAVPCGPHDIVFTSTHLGLERRISINVHPGEKVKRIVELEASAPTAGLGTPGLPGLPSLAGVGGRAGEAAAGGDCHLSLGSRPWSEVWIDGTRVGITPLLDLVVGCGKHDLLFLSREANVEHRESVLVRPGQTLKKVVTLVEGD